MSNMSFTYEKVVNAALEWTYSATDREDTDILFVEEVISYRIGALCNQFWNL